MQSETRVPDAVKPFSAKPRESFGYLLRETSRRLDRAISRSLGTFGLTVSQYHLLRELWEVEGLSVRELSWRVNITEPSTLKSVNLMAEQRLVVVRIDSTDRRKRLVFLTAKGLRLRNPVLDEVARVSLDAYTHVDRADMHAALRVFRAIELRLEAPREKKLL